MKLLVTGIVDINKELNKDEKVGDLYKIVQQEKNAQLYFEKHIEAKLYTKFFIEKIGTYTMDSFTRDTKIMKVTKEINIKQ